MTILENGTTSAICLVKRFISLVHFTSAFPKKSDGFPLLMYLFFLLIVLNRSWKYDGQLFRAEDLDLRLLKWFQKSLILKDSKVETSSLSLFYACVTCHLVGLNGVQICQLFVVSESVKTAKDFMFDTLPYKIFDVNCEIAKIECFFVISLLIKYYWANTLNVKVRLRYPNRTRPS